MDTRQNPFGIYDVITATDESIQFAFNRGVKVPPTDDMVVLGIEGDKVLLGDGEAWHHSHFYKVGEHPLKGDALALQGVEADLAVPRECEDCASPLFALDGICEFDEAETFDELAAYVLNTYDQHYAKGGVQAMSLIAKRPSRGLDFVIGNILKYADRYGEKEGRNRKDLLKIAHYAILAIHCHDKLEKNNG